MNRIVVGIIGAFLFVVAAPGCGGSPPVVVNTATSTGYPTEIAAPSDFDGDFALEQEVTIRHQEGENSFRAVLQKSGDRMVLLALGPHGGRGFALRQTGSAVTYENYLPVELPFPPEYILYDVHRSWFQPVAPAADGSHVVERDGERITELWNRGRLMERVYERLDQQPAGAITVRYLGGLDPAAPHRAQPPDVIELDNGWFGYHTTVRTLSWQAIPSEETDG